MKHTLVLSAVVAAALASAGVAQQGTPGAHFIENWDLDNDGQVTVAEATQKRGELFVMFDQDENGALDDAEYDLFDETRNTDIKENAGGAKGPMQGVSKAMTREFNDVDADGQVTRDEFLSRVPAWFDKMDRDGDRVITQIDFGHGKG